MSLFNGLLGDGWDDPKSQAMMALAGGLLSGDFGRGAKDYGNVMAGARDKDMQRQLLKSQLDENMAQTAYRTQQAKQAEAAQAEAQRIQGIVARAGQVPMGMGSTEQIENLLPPSMRIQGQPALQQPGKIDFRALMQQGVPFETLKNLAATDNLGREEVARVQDIEGPNGTKLLQGFDKFGKPVGQGASGYLAPQLVNQGDRQTFVKPSAGVSLPTFQDANSKASTAVAWANNALANRKFAFDQAGGADGGVSQAGFNKQFGKPAAGFRWKPDGSMESIPGGPADQKAQLQEAGQGTVSSVVTSLRDEYNKLGEKGGITDPSKGIFSNLAAGMQSSGVGQSAGRMFGTENQSARNTIAQQRPILLQAIMKATGMSAKQMDSNAELKLYLATATDPTLDIAANKRALDMIENLYGGGAKPQGASSTGGTPSPSAAQAANTFDGKPPAQNFKNQTATGPDGKRYRSDGMIWKEIK